MSDVTPPALSGTSHMGIQAHGPSLDRQTAAQLATQEVAPPVTHAVNQDGTALLAGVATCLPPTVAGGIVCCADSCALGVFMGSIGVSASACMTLSAAAHDAALIGRSGPEAQSQRCVPDSSPTTVCGAGLVSAGIGLTGLGVAGIGVPTTAVPLTLVPTWVGMATACYGREVPADQCMR